MVSTSSKRPRDPVLVAAAGLSVIAALLHVGCIIGGPAWYRLFGAGEAIAQAAEQGSWYPALITSGITLVLVLWAAYALSAASVIRPLPWLKAGVVAITAVYLLRGLALLPVLAFRPEQATSFAIWSSLVCLAYGAVHLYGVTRVWKAL